MRRRTNLEAPPYSGRTDAAGGAPGAIRETCEDEPGASFTGEDESSFDDLVQSD